MSPPTPADTRAKPPQRDWLVRPTARGRKAQEVWRPLAAVIEERWRERFGNAEIEALRASLAAVLGRIDLALPDYLPVLGYGLFSHILSEEKPRTGIYTGETLKKMDLHTLLAKVLLAFVIEFELEWKISLPVSANVLRLIDAKGVRVADLPLLSGIAKEGVAFATGWLERHGFAVVEPDSKAGRAKLIRLNPKGEEARQAYLQRLDLVERRWRERFGDEAISALRESLSALIHQKKEGQPTLSEGLAPYPDGWRARKPYVTRTLAFIEDPAAALPHFPMVLHRGGYPDGS